MLQALMPFARLARRALTAPQGCSYCDPCKMNLSLQKPSKSLWSFIDGPAKNRRSPRKPAKEPLETQKCLLTCVLPIEAVVDDTKDLAWLHCFSLSGYARQRQCSCWGLDFCNPAGTSAPWWRPQRQRSLGDRRYRFRGGRRFPVMLSRSLIFQDISNQYRTAFRA